MIQVPECTQSHGGPTVKAHHIQLGDYGKKVEVGNSYFPPTSKLLQPVSYPKPALVPKSEEDLNLGEWIFNVTRVHSLVSTERPPKWG